WQAVLNRDASASSAFVYCVRTTRIYCRTTCPSRRPARLQVTFEDTSGEAEIRGYRPCKRCSPASRRDKVADSRDELTRQRQNSRLGSKMTIKAIAADLGVSIWRIHRIFKHETGMSPEAWLREVSLSQ
ncbi:hypothetical protein FA10DRAFT_215702, partial [Acaromyces ingoldii]